MNIKRISLLSDTEITDLYSRPDLNQYERRLYFTLNPRELAILNKYSNIKTRIYFILQLGYFKAKQQFFKFDLADAQHDVEYVISHFYSGIKKIVSGQISRDYISQQKNDILQLFSYQD